ncbi:MAG: DsbE family thiol:disulfide interchange protein [Hyphomicrobiaceae bacterium]
MNDTDTTSAGTSGRNRSSLLYILPLLIFVGMAALFAFALGSGDPSKLPSTLIGHEVPGGTLPPLEGLRDGDRTVPGFTDADLRKGDVTVVNFFASWCVPCVQEHPMLIELGKRTGVRMLGINYKDPVPGGRRFLGRYGNPYSAVGVDANGRTAIEWGVYGMPETFLVDGNGRIFMKQIGPISAEDLKRRIIPAIEKTRRAATANPS